MILFFSSLLTACPFIETDGEVEIINDSSSPIVSVNIDSGCSNGWSGEHSTNIPINGSQRFKVDAGDYDIRACREFQGTTLCAIWYDEWVDWDKTVTFRFSYREGYTTTKESSC